MNYCQKAKKNAIRGEMAFSSCVGLWTKEKGTKKAFAFFLSQVRLCSAFAALKSVKMRQCALRVFDYLQCSSLDLAMTMNDEVLNSWKEIASYMGRGVRTVQRWEQELGLPVRRPRGKSHSAVIAFKSELDRWLHSASGDLVKEQNGEAPTPGRRARPHDAAQRQAQLHSNTHTLVVRTQMLVSRSYSLCDKLRNLQERLERNLKLTSHRVVERKERDLGPVAVSSSEASKPATEQLRKDHAIAS